MRIEHSDLSLPVYERIKAMILNKELQPGEKLLQEKLAANGRELAIKKYDWQAVLSAMRPIYE